MRIFETDRLRLRPWNPETEAELAFAIYSDPEVSRFLGTPDESVEARREKIWQRNQKHLELNEGSGCWAIEEKATATPIGTAILQRLPDGAGELTPDWEVGWHLKRSVWGRGYATEAARVLLEYGFTELQLPVIYAVANPENYASIRVMERLGMSPKGRTQKYYGAELVLFEILRSSSHD
ncbi:GNAT family N-acetyltransferase [Leptolyngbya ohadii]|uniref:GNAT family N-acetyltransferase n=1 Tax=Leptolyngbya ohadii TaxID=1962290 RepID=UPI000B59B144|nr:GNAT family N-acetyltransferase [Leptolyngbya ohadii]